MQTKKEFLYTICAGTKNLDFPGKAELVDTITRAGEKLQKVTQKKNVHQDISDTLKRGLLKNANIRGLYWKLLIIANVIRHIGRVVEQIGRTPGQAAAVFPFFQPLKVSRDFRVPKKVCARTRP